MKLIEAMEALKNLKGKRFSEIFDESQLENIIKNKGKSGQIIELAIGLNNTNTTLDFEDGELKTNKCDSNSNPLETMFITQVSSIIDELLNKKAFEETKLYKKISNLLYVPISKDGNEKNWFIIDVIHINLNEKKYQNLLKQLKDDYYSICDELNYQIKNNRDGYIHTCNGEYIQIRTKDSKPYTPIFSQKYEKFISDKNRAFYFKKDFMRYILNSNT